MNKKDLRDNRIRTAIDECLSGVEEMPNLQYKVLQKTKGEVKVKKKISVAVVLAAVLALAAVGAVAAALLSVRDIVEEQAIPMASQSVGDIYSVEETRKLVALAEENGIVLSEEAQNSIEQYLDNNRGYYKEEMIMALAKAEFGDDPAAWSLEEQKWFDDVCVMIGVTQMEEKSMPKDGEQVKSSLIQAATKHIHQTYDGDAPLDDPSKYNIGTQYLCGDEEYNGTYWSILYSPLYLEGAEYWVYMRDDGSILGDIKRPGLEPDSTVTNVLSSFCRIFGSENTWDQSTMRAFKEAAMNATDKNSREYLCLKETYYPDIPANAISKKQANTLAAEYIGLSETLSSTYVFLIDDEPNPVFKVMLAQNGVYWSVEVDCITGQIKNSRLLDAQHQKWWMHMVLWEISDQVDINYIDNSESVG